MAATKPQSTRISLVSRRTTCLTLRSTVVRKARLVSQRRVFNQPELDKLLDSFYLTIDNNKQRKVMDDIQLVVAENMPYVPVFNNPIWYQYNETRFEGFFSADNPVARPQIHPEVPERLLHLLSIKPKS